MVTSSCHHGWGLPMFLQHIWETYSALSPPLTGTLLQNSGVPSCAEITFIRGDLYQDGSSPLVGSWHPGGGRGTLNVENAHECAHLFTKLHQVGGGQNWAGTSTITR